MWISTGMTQEVLHSQTISQGLFWSQVWWYILNPESLKSWGRRTASSRPYWATEWIPGQPRRDSVSMKKHKEGWGCGSGVKLVPSIREALGQPQDRKMRGKKKKKHLFWERSLILATSVASWGEGIILKTGEQKNCSSYSIVSTTEFKLV